MEKKTCFYETLFVVSGAISEEDAKSVQDKFTTLIAENGNLIAVNEWGKRRLAYPINKVSDGYYVLASFESAPEFPLELERLLGINDAILRSMTTRLEKAPVFDDQAGDVRARVLVRLARLDGHAVESHDAAGDGAFDLLQDVIELFAKGHHCLLKWPQCLWPEPFGLPKKNAAS